jgi:hypothetical protein
MTWSMFIGPVLGAWLQAVSPPAVSPPENVSTPVIIPPALTNGDLNDAVAQQLEASLREAVQKSDLELAKTSENVGRRATACADNPCRAELIEKSEAKFLLVPEITLDDKDYHFRLVLYGSSGSEAARLEETCSLCGLAEATDLMADLGARIGRKVDLAARAAIVEIRTEPPGARVLIGGELVGLTPLELPLDAGIHQLRIESVGYIGLRRRVEVVAGETTELDLHLQPVPPKPARDHGKLFAGLGGFGLVSGVGSIAGGAVMLALDQQPITSDCSGVNIDADGTCRWRYATLEGGIGMLVGGAALIGTGVALLVVGRKKFPSSKAARLQPTWEGLVLRF